MQVCLILFNYSAKIKVVLTVIYGLVFCVSATLIRTQIFREKYFVLVFVVSGSSGTIDTFEGSSSTDASPVILPD